MAADSVLICAHCGKPTLAGPAACPSCGAALAGKGSRLAMTGSTGAIVMLLLGAAAAGGGVLMGSQATAGPTLVGAGCFLAIAARLAQASNHQKNLHAALVRLFAAPPPPKD